MWKRAQSVLRAARPQVLVSAIAVGAALGGVVLPVRAAPQDSARVFSHAIPRVAGASTSVLVAPPPAPAVDCAQVPCLALTFDDGPNEVTPQVLAALERHHARATFFLIGIHVPGHEESLRRMHRDGDEIGNHSWSHPDLTTLPVAQIRQQVMQAQQVISNAGVPAPTLFRPPYGALNTAVRSQVPLTIAMWNVDPQDWNTPDPKKIIAATEANARPGRVIDLHDIHQQTADSLDQLLTDLQAHYQLVTFSELFSLAPGQPGVFYGR